MTKKVKRISSLQDQNQEIMLIEEHNGELHFFTMDEIEDTLNEYFQIKSKLEKEKDLREKYTHIMESWNDYQTSLCLVIDNSDDVI